MDHTSCATCAAAANCAWYGALHKHLRRSEAPFAACEGEVRAPEACPYPFAETSAVTGSLVVRGDAALGGGNLVVRGPCD